MLTTPRITTASLDARCKTMNNLMLGFVATPVARWFFPSRHGTWMLGGAALD